MHACINITLNVQITDNRLVLPHDTKQGRFDSSWKVGLHLQEIQGLLISISKKKVTRFQYSTTRSLTIVSRWAAGCGDTMRVPDPWDIHTWVSFEERIGLERHSQTFH